MDSTDDQSALLGRCVLLATAIEELHVPDSSEGTGIQMDTLNLLLLAYGNSIRRSEISQGTGASGVAVGCKAEITQNGLTE
jgi:hypothetical protein